MKFKDPFHERDKKKQRAEEFDAYMSGLSAEDRFSLISAFAKQVFGCGHDEAALLMRENFSGGAMSTRFLNSVLEAERKGQPYILMGEE